MATAPPPESVEEAAARAAAAARSVFGDLTSGGGASAFGAFGAPPSAPIHAGGSAFGGVSAATSSAFGTSAFGGGGGGSAFGGGGGTSAFAPAAATSAFSAVPTPLFRPVSAVPEELDDGGEEEEEDEEEEAPDDFDLDHDEGEDEAAGEVEQAKRGAGQISTLEVLGEDSDARKKRFEATLPNNRYMELKPLREAERLRAIKTGLIPDPSKPMRLDQATDFAGTCDEMCPEWEREEREYQNNVDPLERYPGTSRIDPSRAVKAFHRPAAGNDQPLPGDVRPPRVLHQTLDYLFHTLLPTLPLHVTHPFLRDRTRSVRQDFTVQNSRGRSAVEAHERIARYHILALGALREQSGFSESQELEQLRKVLKSLNEFYDDARLSSSSSATFSFPNEPEFRSYNLLTHLRDPDIIWSTELLPPSVFSSPLLQTALSLSRLAQKSNLLRGERASPNAFARFFKLVADPSVPYLFGCILSTHFGEVRRNALEALRSAFLKQHSAFPLRTVAKVLGCDDEDEARSVCEQLGVVVRAEDSGRLVAELHKGAVLKIATLKPRVSKRLVEAKRGKASYQDVIDGHALSAHAVVAVPRTPTLASASTPSSSSAAFSFPPRSAPPASSAPPPSLAAPTPHRFVAVAASPIPTPVPTPPPPSTSTAFGGFGVSKVSAGGLSGAASAFVPAPTATSSPFVPSASVAPATSANGFFSKPLPVSAASAPAFSFAPTAVPAPAPPAAVKSAAPPSFFGSSFAAPPPSTSLPTPAPPFSQPAAAASPSALQAAVTASPFVPSSTALPVPPTPLSGLPPNLTTTAPHNRRTSTPLTGAHNPTTSSALTSHITSAHALRRLTLIDTLSRSLTAELLSSAVSAPVRRLAASALKERWAAISASEAAAARLAAEEAAKRAVEELARLQVAEGCLRVRREEGEGRRCLKMWVRRTVERVEGREREDERRREWEGVVSELRRREMEDEEVDGESDEEVVEEMEEDDGWAGEGEMQLDFGGLSLEMGGDGGAVAKTEEETAEERDWEMAERVREAAASRARIWSRSTFLPPLLTHLSHALSLCPPSSRLSFRPTWTTLVYAPPSAFGTWLACKFGVEGEGGEMAVERRTEGAKVVVRMVGEERVEKKELDSTGLIVFDCTRRKDESFDWPSARTRLTSLVEQATSRSLFAPAVLVVLCPDRTLTAEEEDVLRTTVTNNLNLPALTSLGVAASSVYVAHLDGAEKAFEKQVEMLLDSFAVREERIPRPLNLYLNPLLKVWGASLAKSYAVLQEPSFAPALISSYIPTLQLVVDQAEGIAVPRLHSHLDLPYFPTDASSIRFAVESYISLGVFTPAGNFPDIATTLTQRPPLPDLPLARLLLEHLSAFVSSSLASSPTPSTPPTLTQQGHLDTSLPEALATLEEALGETEEHIRAAVVEKERAMEAEKEKEKDKERERQRGRLSVPSMPTGNGGGKKRRASAAPAETSSPKKPFVNGISHAGRSAAPSPPSHARPTAPFGLDFDSAAGDEEEVETKRIDRLGALEGLLKDARALLAR